jgi:uncharacterized membrane protein YgdD (TMEM256/DUF423 family)
MHKGFLTLGAIFGGLAVALGAFAAHGLERLTTDLKYQEVFQTGAEHQMYHALALIATAIIYEKYPNRYLRWAGMSFTAGILFFSGSLYVLTLLNIQGSSASRLVGPITPIGGLLLIMGWTLLLIGVRKRH